jgi:hypothetical protein
MRRDLALAGVRMCSTRTQRLRSNDPTHIGVRPRVSGTALRPRVPTVYPHGTVVQLGTGETVTVRADASDPYGYTGRLCTLRGDSDPGRWLVLGHVRYRHGQGHHYGVVHLDTGRTIVVALSRTDLRSGR